MKETFCSRCEKATESIRKCHLVYVCIICGYDKTLSDILLLTGYEK